MFGIGSAIKDAFRKAVPNELAEIAVTAAPFVAPFNPAIAAAMAIDNDWDLQNIPYEQLELELLKNKQILQ